MKILISLSSYGDKNLHLLNHVIDVYKSYQKYDVTIDVHCTVSLERNDINQIVHDNPETTSLFHRRDFIQEQDNYDLFLFAEYDMLIQEHCIDIFLKYDKLLPIDHCLGFIRYENTPEGIPYLIDLWKNIPGYHYIYDDNIEIKNNKYFSLSNVHQACYILPKNKLKYIINHSNFDIQTLNTHGPELSSSGIFQRWPIGPHGLINKVLPLNREDLEKCFIHHMADCHCNPPGVNSDHITFRNNTVTKDLLFENLSLY
jgi:hypothetical protein